MALGAEVVTFGQTLATFKAGTCPPIENTFLGHCRRLAVDTQWGWGRDFLYCRPGVSAPQTPACVGAGRWVPAAPSGFCPEASVPRPPLPMRASCGLRHSSSQDPTESGMGGDRGGPAVRCAWLSQQRDQRGPAQRLGEGPANKSHALHSAHGPLFPWSPFPLIRCPRPPGKPPLVRETQQECAADVGGRRRPQQ